jgi:non-ribosomal peptide synthase protein (TIGR01720 family)
VLVDVESHGRAADGLDLSRTVGWLTETHPVRLEPGPVDLDDVRAGGPDAGQLIKTIKEQVRAVPGDGLGYGLLRYLNPETAPVLGALPPARIGFNYLGRFGAGPANAWRQVGQGGGTDPAMSAPHAVDVLALVHDGPDGPVLEVTVSWPEHLFGEDGAAGLADAFSAMLAGLARHATQSGGGGHTPSDFSLVALDQGLIDELEAEFTDQRGSW